MRSTATSLSDVRGNLELGDSVSDSFKRAVIFPPFVVRMINVGEESGTLPEQLAYIAEQYREKLSVIVATIGKAIEPLILMMAGTVFAVIIIGPVPAHLRSGIQSNQPLTIPAQWSPHARHCPGRGR